MKSLDGNTWPLLFSWTKNGGVVLKGNPDGSTFTCHMHSGPFFFIQLPLVKKLMFEFYTGFRPTAGYDPKYDNSGFVRFIAPAYNWFFGRLLKADNFGMALRIVHY